MNAAQRATRLVYYFGGAKPPEFFDPPGTGVHSSTLYRNPIVIAQEWQRMLGTQECASRANLARMLGVSRARVTQVLGLLALAPEVVQALAALGDPLAKPIVTERRLRTILKLPIAEQKLAVGAIVGSLGDCHAYPSAFDWR